MKPLSSRGFAPAFLPAGILTIALCCMPFAPRALARAQQSGSGSGSGQSSSNPPPASTPQSQTGNNGTANDKAPVQVQGAKKSTDDTAADDPTVTKMKLLITNNQDKPVANASVYIRYNEPGGFLHKDHLSEMNFKTNDDGTVKIPEVPLGKVLIQVVAKGYHTYGKWYDIAKDPDPITIKLDPPPHWY
jgi:uncharacterized iron-regulated membrane protein